MDKRLSRDTKLSTYPLWSHEERNLHEKIGASGAYAT
jgi:hypothetical protein